VVAFGDQPAGWQSDILSLHFPNDLPPATPAPALSGDPKVRYLIPNHPGTQPMPPDSAWCHYTAVAVPADQRVPAQALAPMEQALTQAAGGTDPYRSRPKIIPSATIDTTFVRTPDGIFPADDDETQQPPGTNLLPTIEHDMYNRDGNVMPNTLPSTKAQPYNLHAARPVVTLINPASPADDLRYVLDTAFAVLTGKSYKSLWEDLSNPLADLERQIAQSDTHALSMQGNRYLLIHLFGMAVDIIEGNNGPTSRVPGDRAYRGFALLHHSGQNRISCVVPEFDASGKNVIGGNVNVHQIWYGGRIESDTMFLDFGWEGGTSRCGTPGMAPFPPDVPWTITYKIDVLNRGGDDFSPATMYFNSPAPPAAPAAAVAGPVTGAPTISNKSLTSPAQVIAGAPIASAKETNYLGKMIVETRPVGKPSAPPINIAFGPPHVSMDQTFFPMQDSTETILKVKMAPAKYYNLTYTWGWRFHPPRAQAMENAHKILPAPINVNIVDEERQVFGTGNPIDKLGDLAPAKRMWRAFNSALQAVNSGSNPDYVRCLQQLIDARNAYQDWLDRNHLPSGVQADPKSDLTLLFVNNTIYGQLTDGGTTDLLNWTKRGDKVRVTLINGDYFPHGYLNVDFGGNRGWENQFKSAIKVGGSGTFFSFGRFHWRFNTVPASIGVAPAQGFDVQGKPIKPGDMPATVTPGVHRVVLEMNFEPSRRLRFYQFDPLHHDVAIYSVH
ncbi:MAG TPA: hypothetical protein VFJ58_15540, partial [Armatimonadota bacterium]|nr:hypothetical protein [Armatimonadota bacterium]